MKRVMECYTQPVLLGYSESWNENERVQGNHGVCGDMVFEMNGVNILGSQNNESLLDER